MKKFKFITLAFTVVLMLSLQSCLGDSNEYELDYSNLAISTLKMTDSGTIDYFTLDDGAKMFPGDTTSIRYTPEVAGQRVFVYFNELQEKVDGYEYNIEVKNIQSILTKEIIPLTAETADSIGDNHINALRMWVAQGYLTIEFQLLGTNSSTNKHMLNLVQNETADNKEDGYISLEFRHNAKKDYPEFLGEGYVSFKLDKIAEQMKNAKGLSIRVNTIYNGEKFHKIDFKKEEKTMNLPAEVLNKSARTAKIIF